MTNEEAIERINEHIAIHRYNEPQAIRIAEALQMAIEALKEQPERSQNTSSKQAVLETLGVKTGETCEDVISRRDAIDAILADKIDAISLKVMTALGDGRLALTLNDACDRHIRDIEKLPSAHSKQLQVLADVLDGCPLTQPCDKMWKPEGWCKEHCKPGQQEPDAECWLKYAEEVAKEAEK